MFFQLSKILRFLLDPLTWIFSGILLVLCLARFRRPGFRPFFALFFVAVYLPCTPAFSGYLLSRLERTVADGYLAEKEYDYVVVLSGYVNLWIYDPVTNPFPFGEPVERLLAGISIAKKHPEAKLLLSGGNGSLKLELGSEAEVVADFLRKESYLPAERIRVEATSRNTYENAVETARLLPPEAEVLLVTSAFHMRRSLGAFRAAGLSPDPHPVDFRTVSPEHAEWRFSRFLPSSHALSHFLIWIREMVGTVAYRLTGRYHAAP